MKGLRRSAEDSDSGQETGEPEKIGFLINLTEEERAAMEKRKAGIAAKSVLTKKIEKNSAKSRSNDGRVEAKPNGSLQQTAKIKSGNSCGSRSNCGFFGKQSFVMVEQNFFAVVVG